MLRTSARSLVASSSRSAARVTVPTVARSAQRGLRTCAGVQVARTLQQNVNFAAPRAAFHSTRMVAAPETVKVPQMAESLTEGTLRSFSYEIGDFVEQDAEIASIETDKIDVSVNAPFSGTITEFLANPDDTVQVGQDLLKMEKGEGGAAPKADEGKKEESAAPKEEPVKDEKKPEPKKEEPKKEEKPAPAPAPKQEKKEPAKKEATPEPASSKAPGAREETRVKMSRMRQTIAKRLKETQNTAASLTTFNEIDMTNIMEFRGRWKDRVLKETGVKLGFMSAFSKAAADALQAFPMANASVDGDQIVYRNYADISVAVSTEKGLVTPVLRNVEGMGMIEIEQAIAGLAKKARDNKLAMEDMSGGTFTISNGGVWKSWMSTPILNQGQAAILGMHDIKMKPWVVGNEVKVRPIMVVALTYDHRLLDGREAVQFLVRIKENIEDMGRMLL
ncbi:hypothetical protein FFLO_05248 [Filobasidium floriforme]|uniref:dihydrolipoyllysine-residue succinyltransferase n=1 Tax=Filobasidium floriforme TaxID=5210 RepID=A0A8K0NP56_9TREE|nr:hypothetical protein FFLO_05248 [Filobasidium floriforme]